MKDKVICERYNDCPLKNGIEDCYHITPHYTIDNCIPDSDSRCGNCKSMKEIRKLKILKIDESR